MLQPVTAPSSQAALTIPSRSRRRSVRLEAPACPEVQNAEALRLFFSRGPMGSRIRMEQHLAVGPQRMPLLNEDARILALETGPIRGHTLKVLVLEDTGEPLSVEGLRRQLAERLSEE